VVPVTHIKAFLFPHLKFYRKFTFFHNAISLNLSSAIAFSQETLLEYTPPKHRRDSNTILITHSRLPKVQLRLIISRSLTEYVNINKGL
jgi:hypothetical protein